MALLSLLLFSVNVTECDSVADSSHYAHDVVVSSKLKSTPEHASFYVGRGVSRVPAQFVAQSGVFLLFDGVCPSSHLLVTAYWPAFDAIVAEQALE